MAIDIQIQQVITWRIAYLQKQYLDRLLAIKEALKDSAFFKSHEVS